MNIRYQITKNTNLEPYVIKAYILLKLKDKKYRVQKISDNSVTFDDNPWKIMWRHEAIRRLDAGRFEFTASDNCTTITFTHYLSLWPQLMLFAFAILFSVINGDYFGIIFFGSFILITTAVQYVISKNIGENLLKSILIEGVSD